MNGPALLRTWLAALALALAGCGGGGGGAGPAAIGPAGDSASAGSTGAGDPGGTGTGAGGGTSAGSGSGSGGGTSAGSSGSGTGGGSSAGSGTGAGDGGTGVAGGDTGVGSGGTGVSDGGGTGVAGVGDGSGAGTGSGGSGVGSGGDTGVAGGDTGVGSGGTGATASAVGIGSVDGLGSIIVNGVRYDTSVARFSLSDASDVKLGMTVRVTGVLSADRRNGTATLVTSAPELRGQAIGVEAARGRFTVLGVPVGVDNATVIEGARTLADVGEGDAVRVWGLAVRNGELRATRIERLAGVLPPVVTGTVQGLDTARRTFRIGSVTVDYAQAVVDANGSGRTLADGEVVRAEGLDWRGGVLQTTSVRLWQTLPREDGALASLGGVVTDAASLASFRVHGVEVNAAGARLEGGTAADVRDGTRVDVSGRMQGGVLVAERLRIRSVPGGPTTATVFSASGPVGQFRSRASFTVQGQRVDASSPGVVFENGTAANLGPGQRISATGTRVVEGVLLAERIRFLLPEEDGHADEEERREKEGRPRERD